MTITYDCLDDATIAAIPLRAVQESGLLFLWVINSKYRTALNMIRDWGYRCVLWCCFTARLVGDITWVKISSRGLLGHGNGHYLQHSKETCLVAMKGSNACVDPSKLGMINDIIFAKRKGQSQKPNEIYTLIESLVPEGRVCDFRSRVGFYLEVFGRWNNLRNNWVTIGNELYFCLFRQTLAHVATDI